MNDQEYEETDWRAEQDAMAQAEGQAAEEHAEALAAEAKAMNKETSAQARYTNTNENLEGYLTTTVLTGMRCCGKTTKLIELSANTRAVIVCQDLNMAKIIKRMARNMEMDIPEPVSYHQLENNSRIIPSNKSILLDDVEMFLQSIFRRRILGMTIGTHDLPITLKMRPDQPCTKCGKAGIPLHWNHVCADCYTPKEESQ